MAAVAAAAGMDENEKVALTAALLKEHFPEIAADLSREGADAERARIQGLEANALPGHEKLLAAHKADGTKQPADLAMAIVAAEKAQRAAQLTGLDADEAKVKGLAPAPANSTAETPHPLAGLKGKELWEAEYKASEDLQSEFPTMAAYVGWMSANAEGRVRTTNKAS